MSAPSSSGGTENFPHERRYILIKKNQLLSIIEYYEEAVLECLTSDLASYSRGQNVEIDTFAYELLTPTYSQSTSKILELIVNVESSSRRKATK